MIKNTILIIFSFFLILNFSTLAVAQENADDESAEDKIIEELLEEDEDVAVEELPAEGVENPKETTSDTEEGMAGASLAEAAPLEQKEEEANLVYRGLEIRPSLHIQQIIVDNVFAKYLDDDEKEDHLTVTTLGMRLNLDKWGHSFEIDGRAVNTSYNEYTEEESHEKFATLRAQIMKDKLIEFNVKGKYVDSFERRTDAVMPSHILLLPNPRQNHYIDRKISGGASLNYGRSLRIDADYSFEEWEFDDKDNAFRERQIDGIDVTITSANGEYSDFVVEYRMQDFNYVTYNTINTFGLDNREHTAYMGFRWNEPNYKGIFRLGVTKKTFNDLDGFIAHYGDGISIERDKNKADGFLKEVNAIGQFYVFKRVGGKHEFDFGVERYLDEPTLSPTVYAKSLGVDITPQRFIIVDEASIGYRLFFTKNTSMNIGASYNNIEFSDFYIDGEKIVREDETTSISGGVRYKINWLTIALDHQYKTRESNVSDPDGVDPILPDETFDYSENRTMFTIGLHL